MATYIFGVIGDTNLAEGTYGLFQSLTIDNDAEKGEAKDGNGDVQHVTFFNETKMYKGEYILDTLLPLPNIGDIIVVGATDSYLVEKIAESETQGGYKTGTLDLIRYIDGGFPVNA